MPVSCEIRDLIEVASEIQNFAFNDPLDLSININAEKMIQSVKLSCSQAQLKTIIKLLKIAIGKLEESVEEKKLLTLLGGSTEFQSLLVLLLSSRQQTQQ